MVRQGYDEEERLNFPCVEHEKPYKNTGEGT
jgi:hypothetical protein